MGYEGLTIMNDCLSSQLRIITPRAHWLWTLELTWTFGLFTLLACTST